MFVDEVTVEEAAHIVGWPVERTSAEVGAGGLKLARNEVEARAVAEW